MHVRYAAAAIASTIWPGRASGKFHHHCDTSRPAVNDARGKVEASYLRLLIEHHKPGDSAAQDSCQTRDLRNFHSDAARLVRAIRRRSRTMLRDSTNNTNKRTESPTGGATRPRKQAARRAGAENVDPASRPTPRKKVPVPERLYRWKRYAWTERDEYGRVISRRIANPLALAIARADSPVVWPSTTTSPPAETSHGGELKRVMGEAVMKKVNRAWENKNGESWQTKKARMEARMIEMRAARAARMEAKAAARAVRMEAKAAARVVRMEAKAAAKAKLAAAGAKLYRDGPWKASLRDGNGTKIVVGIGFPSREAAAHDLDLVSYALNGTTLCGTALTAEETNDADGWSGNVPGYVLELRTARDDPGLSLAAAGAKLYRDPHNRDGPWKASLRDGNGTKIVVGIGFPSREAAAHDLDLVSYALNGTTLCGTALTDEEKNEADGWSSNVPGYVLKLRTARDDAGLALAAAGAKLLRDPLNRDGPWKASLRDGNGTKIVVGIGFPSREAAAHDLDLVSYALNGTTLCGTALTAEETNDADGWSGNVPGYVLELRTARDDPGLALAAAGAKLYRDPHNPGTWNASLRDGNGAKIIVGIRFPSRKAAAHDLDLALYALNGTTLFGTALTAEETNEADGWSGNVPGYVLELRTARDDPGLADLKAKAIKTEAIKTEAIKTAGAKLYREPKHPGTWNASLRDGNGTKIVVGIRFPSRKAAAHDLDLVSYALNGTTLCGTALTAEETNDADGWSGNVPGYVLELRTARDDPGLADLKAKAIKTKTKTKEAAPRKRAKTGL